MQTKLLEIRDRATFIPAFAMRPLPSNPEQRYLLRRAGYSCEAEQPLVIFGYLRGQVCYYDVYDWQATGSRTMQAAHKYVEEHFDELKDGDVIDVEFILGETSTIKTSERNESYV